MNELVIKLTGKIQDSNFDEWKKDLIAQIHSINKELKIDEDFEIALRQVKSFKIAEDALVKAKQSAINQAADIQRLFAAIDEISGEARQARLSLERQIKARKTEIKNEIIESGIQVVRAFLEQQDDDFKTIYFSEYINNKRFELVTKGKASSKGIQSAINSLCFMLKQEISEKAFELKQNIELINNISDEYNLLFQDRKALLALSKNELYLTVENRIAKYKEEKARKKADSVLRALEVYENTTLNLDNDLETETIRTPIKEQYKIIVHIFSSEDAAKEIARDFRQKYAGNEFITKIRLRRDYTDGDD